MAKRKKLNKRLRVHILARDEYRCRMCARSGEGVVLQVDHIVPISTGGTDVLDNLATLCQDCNAGKSAYNFPNYASMTVIPDSLEGYFKFVHDPKTGDFEQYHLYCYFKQAGGSLTSQGEFHHTWRITDTEWSLSSDPAALASRRKSEETRAFKEIIRRSLASERKRLVVNEEGLAKV